YEGRAIMEIDGQTSRLHLSKVTMKDSRRYQCSVMIPNDDEGTTAATTSLLVLVPPSPPICRIQGEAAYWHNVTLTCMSNEGSPIPVYEWKSYSVKNTPRQFPPKTIEKDGALSLFNISRDTSGFYICTSTNRIGSASCNFTLAVTPGNMNIGSTAGIIVGVLAGVVLLGIVILCYCKKKGKKEKYAEGGKERHDGKGSDVDSQRYQEDQQDRRRGSRDRLDDERSHYSGSQDRLDDQRNRSSGSRDRLDDQRGRYGGSRDRLDDQRDRYRGSRDRLDDQRDRYGGSRDRLDDQRDRYGGSRDRLDDQRNHYGGSRDRLDDQRDRYGGSRDRLDDRRDRSAGSRDRLDYIDDQNKNRY
uniref:Ig-like domain-containing protein n=1 Tax=Sander lucioperca TaxID=283035 RepID=A0A8D0CX55_SANLU